MANQHRTVWKYPIPVQDDPVNLVLPADAQILDVMPGEAADEIFVWALVAPDAFQEHRRFVVRGTGQSVPADVTHVGTVHWVRPQWPSGANELVWHLFEVVAA